MSAYVKVGGEFALDAEAGENQAGANTTVFADGSYLMTWTVRSPMPASEFVIKAQRFDTSGGRIGAEFEINSSGPGSMTSPSVAELADGGFIATWIHYDETAGWAGRVTARLFDAAGTALGEEFTVNPGDAPGQQYAEVNALSNGGAVITWEDYSYGGGSKAQLIDASGAPVGQAFTIGQFGFDGYTDVVALDGGGFVLSWRAGGWGAYDVYARIFDNAGNVVGADFRLNTVTAGDQYSQRLTALADGGFVALWENASSDDIKGQRFDASGAKVGGEFMVNQTSGMQQLHEATALDDGGFIVTWTTYTMTPNGTEGESMARQFAADGTPVGNEFMMNTLTGGSQGAADLAVMSDGRVLATWTTLENWGYPSESYELRAQYLFTGSNAAVQITSQGGAVSASFTLAENATAVTTVAATDADGPLPVTYWIGGGADAGLFAIDKSSGALSFLAGPDFESPTDADEDGVYQVIVEARDGLSVDTQAISVAVTDLADGLSFRYTSLTALENGLAGPTLLALGGGGAPMSYTVVGGADAALLALDAQTGELSFLAEQDREAPGDADGDGVYEVEVIADDGTSSVTRTISVALGNVNEGQVFLSGTEWTVAENEYLAATVVATDIDGDPLEYGVIGGADGWLFEIGSEGFLGFSEPADFEAPSDADGDNVYEVEVIAYDGDLYTTQLLTITVTDAEDPLPLSFVRTAFEVSEIVDFSAALELTGDSSGVFYSIVGGADSWLFNVDSYTGQLSMIFGAFDYEAPYDSDGDNLYEIQVEAYDYNTDDAVTGTVTVAVRDAVNEELFFVTDDDWAGAENEAYVGTVLAYDAQYDALTYSVIGGDDGALFTIVPETGDLFFLTAPVIGAPGDVDGDNVYELEVAVTDGQSIEYQTITVTLGNVVEPGFAETSFEAIEHEFASAALVPTVDGEWTFSITGGADGAQFMLGEANDIVFLGGDFEAPADSDGDNVYEVEVTAVSDGGSFTELVTFSVLNVNEEPWFEAGGTWSLPEGADQSYWHAATDPDGDDLSYFVAGGADADKVYVDAQTGAFSFYATPDFEAPGDADGNNVYEVQFGATDGELVAYQTLQLSIYDLPETISFSSTAFSPAENTTTAGHLQLADGYEAASYEITGGADAGLFAITGYYGNRTLTFVGAPNFEAPADANGDGIYEVQITAELSLASTTETFLVTVGNVNEAPLVTSNGGGSFAALSVSEGVTSVTTVAASDPEGGLTYSIVGGADGARFTLNASTGTLSFATVPNFEVPGDLNGNNIYVVVVRATDGSLSDTQELAITVGNAAPTITSGGGAASAAVTTGENSTVITTVAASDPAGGTVSYALAGGPDAALFAINASTGALSFLAAPDFEAPADAGGDNIYDVIVSASDGSQGDAQALAISVGNVNEGPVITSNGGGAAAALTIGEDATAVTTVAAEDSEGGVVYAIVGGSDAALFTLDAATGALAFLEPQNFESPGDADGDGVYEIVVGAGDGTFSDTQALSVTLSDVNDAPVIMPGANVNNENFTTAGGVWASDPDGDQLSYSIAGGADGHLFRVNFQGALSFRAAPDFEAPGDANGDNVYEVIVGASDGAATSTAAITVTVNNRDEAPDIVSGGGGINANIAVSENATAVTTVVAIDPEGGVTYSLAGHDAALFTLDGVTGVLSFAAAPDFEAPGDLNGDNSYDLMVTASDGTFSAFQYIYVHVGDVNEGVTITSPASSSVLENGTAVATVTASDLDGDAVTFSLAGGADAALFALDAETGALRFVAAPDFETPGDADGDNVYEVVVSASDGSLSDSQALSVTVGNVNEAPAIVSDGGGTSAALQLDEGQSAVTTVVAADLDGPGALVYAITGGPDAALFAIDAVTGVLTLVTAPDYEAPADQAADNFYTVTVTASDGELSAFQAISVLIRDVNEGVTITSATSAAGIENITAVTTVTATDLDGDAITFALAGGADAALFALDAETGALSFLAAPDYETPGDADGDNIFDVVVSASDGSLTDTQALSIALGDVDEAPTMVTPSAWTATENGTSVGVIEAVDPEESWLTYRIVGGADASRFALDSVSGALAFRQAPNFEAPSDADGDNVYNLIVEASDAAHAVTQALTVTVGNVNEAPVITSGSGGASAAYGVSENSLTVAAIAAGDPEGGVTYSLAGGADAARFAIDAGTGVLTFLAAPDFDAPADANGDNLYEVVVRASDGSLADSQALTVTVGNLVDGLTRTGTSRADTLSGTYEEDVLNGLAGNDTLSGLGGADTIDGGDGQDRIYGGTGADWLTGGLKADTFEFDALNESTVGQSDRIVDFSRSQGDKISLSDIDANALVANNQAFSFIGTAAFSNQAGQLRYFQQNGDTFVTGDVNGDGAADFQIVVDPLVSFIASDFLL